jgi:hypothetical protein
MYVQLHGQYAMFGQEGLQLYWYTLCIDTFQRHGGSQIGAAAEEAGGAASHHAASACCAVRLDGRTRMVLKNTPSMSSFPV